MSTGARVGGVRPPGIPRESWLRRKTIKSEAARRVREVTDNRTNEPTEAQVEAAAKGLYEYGRRSAPGRGVWPSWETLMSIAQARYIERARAALEAAARAAQGAAPQAESEFNYCPEHGDLLVGTRSPRCANAPIGHEYAAPVLPSSGVDEDALADVIREAEQSWHLSDEKKQQSYACGAPDLKSQYIARAVAEWLKGQGR